ncbi:MAG: AAA family ATPase [Paludibacteraceae bacterium]|nr:AAA family ATPase [Paludibacteraceae bacterium]
MANIISLTVENFRSYKEETTFTFEAIDADACSGNYHDVELTKGETIRLLNSAVIYGANAAGKSTIITALWALVSFVRESRDKDPEEKIPYEPYLFSSKTKDSPIKLKIDFIVNKERYIYSISYNQMCFVEEKLFSKTQNVDIFDRNKDGVVEFNSTFLPEFKQITYLKNHLALSKLSLEANALIQSIYKELSSIVTIPLLESRSIWGNTQEIASHILKQPQSRFSKMIKDLIVLSDTQIVDVNVSKNNLKLPESWSNAEKKDFLDKYSYEIKLIHNTEEGDTTALPFNAESAGTKTLFTAGARVLEALENGSFLAYDEMNIALHPKLFRRLVELFHNETTNPKHAQLLITTHDATLLEDNLMRADQIWFAEKKDGQSNIYSAIDFEGVSIDQPFETWYRAGRMGGRPNIRPFKFDAEK